MSAFFTICTLGIMIFKNIRRDLLYFVADIFTKEIGCCFRVGCYVRGRPEMTSSFWGRGGVSQKMTKDDWGRGGLPKDDSTK